MRTIILRFFTAAVLGLFLASCGETTAPGPDSQITGQTSTNPEILVRRMDESPPLETRDTTFWAVQGSRTQFAVRYLAPDLEHPETGDLQKFLVITIPQQTQLVNPSGNSLARGDSLLITVKLREQEIMVELGPHGTVFAGTPLQMVMWYAYADMSDAGTRTEDDLGLWYQADPGEPWVLLDGMIDQRGDWIVARVDHFSNYAVAWRE